MLRRLLAWLTFALGSRGRRIALYLLVGLGAAAILWSVFIPDFQIVLDPAAIIFGVAACILAWTLYTLAARRRATAASVAVTYDLRLLQPTFRGGRYRFELEIWYELDFSGGRERSRQARIELVFKRGDHPDLWQWANAQVDEYLRAHRRLATRRFPGANVVALPAPIKKARPRVVTPEVLRVTPEQDEDAPPDVMTAP